MLTRSRTSGRSSATLTSDKSWTDEFQRFVDAEAARGRILEARLPQQQFGESVLAAVRNGGTLIGEAGVGTGKSYGYLIPLIVEATNGKRAVVSTETTALQDQLFDKDLPALHGVYGDFKFRSLKGRSNYLCTNRAPNDHGFILRLRNKDLGDGERRDVERVLGFRVDDDDWDVLRGDTDYCSQNKCTGDKCYSSRARGLALDADIVVTNHALLRTHAEMAAGQNGTQDGLLGDFHHLVVDEAHTLEKVLVDGWGEEASPWDRYKALEAVWDALSATFMSSQVPYVQEAERLMKDALASAVKLFTLLTEKQTGVTLDEYAWKRQNFALSEQYLSGPQTPAIISALEEYELQGPGRMKAASEIFEDTEKKLRTELETMKSGTRKVRKGMNAARKLARLCAIIGEALETRDGIVVKYGVPYAVIADGWKAYKGSFDVRVRCVPLDVSDRAKSDIWDGLKSVTLVSATLSDGYAGDFGYTLKSLGLDDSEALMFVTVNSPFDLAKQQLVYLTPEKDTQVDVPGAQFSMDELTRLLSATDGRALVLFTARTELEYAAEELQRRDIGHQILVQDRGANKQILVDEFKRDTSSVLLASKSFFTGADFPGEACSAVILVKYPLPQWNSLCRAQVAHWRKRGFHSWYDREATLVARQAVGRLIRTESDHGVVALLDQRPGMHDKIMAACQGSYVTRDVSDVKKWLASSPA